MTMIGHAHLPPPEGLSDAYAPGKLIPGVHSRLVQELDRVAAEAGVTPHDITGKLYALTDVEKEYLRGFRRASSLGRLGLIYVGSHSPSVLERGRSICGALTRNFITARFVPREELVDLLFNGRGGLSVDCVVVPDFHYGDAPAATRRALASFLIGRAARGRQTVLGIPNRKVLKEVFGDDSEMYLQHFTIVTGSTPV